MYIDYEWDKWDKRLSVYIEHGKWFREFSVRLMPYCPECKGSGGFHGSEIEPPDYCWYCDGEELVSLRRYLLQRIRGAYWDSWIGRLMVDLQMWQWKPSDDYRNTLEDEWWKALYPEA